MGISKRHHYIPQFLIKRFADADGMLYLYDKEKGAFAKEKRSTKAVFFDMNRNTVDMSGVPNDGMEKLYAMLDERFAGTLKDILDTGNLSIENVGSMLIFASSLKWRVMANDEKFNEANERLGYADLPITIKVTGENDEPNEEAISHLLNSDLFKMSKRVILPFLAVYDAEGFSEEKLLKAYHSSYVHNNDKVISLLGDSPIIEDRNATDDNFGNFIFPIGNHDTFICSDHGNQKITSYAFYVNKDLAMFHQAQKYVVCSDKKHLEQIIQAHKTLSDGGNLNQIMDYIFSFT